MPQWEGEFYFQKNKVFQRGLSPPLKNDEKEKKEEKANKEKGSLPGEGEDGGATPGVGGAQAAPRRGAGPPEAGTALPGGHSPVRGRANQKVLPTPSWLSTP